MSKTSLVLRAIPCFFISLAGAPALAATSLPDQQIVGERPDSYIATEALTGVRGGASRAEIPQSVSVVTRDLLDDLEVLDVQQSMRYVPGANPGHLGTRGFDEYVMRGFVQSSYTFRDGVRQDPGNRVQQEVFGLERVEVLRGPSSVLTGQVGPGGVVNLITKTPKAGSYGSVGLSTGTNALLRTTVDMGTPLADDVQFRLGALFLDRDKDTDYLGEERMFLAPSIRWTPSERTTLTAYLNLQRDELVRGERLPAAGTVLPNPHGQIPFNRFIGEPDFNRYFKSLEQAGLSITHQLASNVALRQFIRYSHYDVDGQHFFGGNLASDFRSYGRRAYIQDIRGSLIGSDQHAELSWSTGFSSHQTMVGVDWYRFSEDLIQYVGTIAPIDLFDPVYGEKPVFPDTPSTANDSVSRQFGIYLQERIRIDRLALLFGLRHDRSKDTTDHRLTGVRTQELRENATTARTGATYLFDNGWAPYASYSQSFLPQAGTDANGEAFDPEEGVQVEVGLRYAPPGGRINAALALYDLRFRNLLTSDPENPDFSIQIGEQRHRGFEAELALQLAAGLRMIAAYTYIDAEITSDNDGFAGTTPRNVPKDQFSAWGLYRFAATPLETGLGVRYIGRAQGDAANTFERPSYTLVDARVGARFGHWVLSVTAQNLANRRYYPGSTSRQFVTVGEARQIIGTVRYDW